MRNEEIARQLFAAVALAASAIIAEACTEPDVRHPHAISVVSGAGQQGEVGAPLPVEIAVQVTDSFGRSVPGAPVFFEIISAPPPGFTSGSVAPTGGETDGLGVVRTRWTLGTGTGEQTLRAWMGNAPTPTGRHVDVSATARPGATTSLASLSGPVVAITVRDSTRVAVTATDRYGNITPTISGLTWQIEDPAVASISQAGLAPDNAAMVVGNAKGATVLQVQDAAGHSLRLDVRTYIGPGRDIAYALNGTIYVLSADGATTTALGPGADPAWSPDGRQIAFSSGGNIHVMNADGSGRRALTDLGTFANAKHPTWSPDGSRIAFVASASRTNPDGSVSLTPGALFAMNADGSSRTLLLFTQGACVRGCVGAQYPTWSPDGTRIAYSSVNYSTPARGAVYVVNADGSGDRMLPIDGIGMEREAAWSPDGGRVAFAGSAPCPYICANLGDLHTINADDTGIRRLTFATATGSSDALPTWSPDSRIAFLRVSYPVNWPGPTELFVVNGDGTEARRVARFTSAITRPAWRPTPQP